MKTIIRKLFITAAVLSIAALSIAGCSKEKAGKVVIKGSTTVLPITQKASEAFQKKSKVLLSIDGSGSGNGIKALIDGGCDIANSSREMKIEELESAKNKGIAVKEIAVAYDMVVPIVNPSNPVTGLTLDQLKGIYDGSINNWKIVGGKDEAIVVVSRDTSSGTYEVWYEKVMKKTDVSKNALLQASNGAIISSVAENPKAIGYVGFGYLNNSVKTIKVNGVDITIENGKSGEFPLSRKLYMYVNEKSLKKEAQEFIDYLLSPEGQGIVKSAGFIPL